MVALVALQLAGIGGGVLVANDARQRSRRDAIHAGQHPGLAQLIADARDLRPRRDRDREDARWQVGLAGHEQSAEPVRDDGLPLVRLLNLKLRPGHAHADGGLVGDGERWRRQTNNENELQTDTTTPAHWQPPYEYVRAQARAIHSKEPIYKHNLTAAPNPDKMFPHIR